VTGIKDLSKIKKILVIRIDRIGDLVYTLPAINTLRESFPGASITALLSPVNEALLKNTAIVDDIIVWKRIFFRKNWNFFKDLRKRNFDLALVFSPRDESYLLAALTEAPLRGGIVVRRRIFIRPYAALCLTHTYILEQEGKIEKDQEVTHEVEKCLGLLKLMGIEKLNREIKLSFPPDILSECKEELKKLTSKNYKGIIGLPLCQRFSRGGWTYKELSGLALAVREKFPDYTLFITYGKEEEKEGKILEEKFSNTEGIKVRGFLPLQLWAAFMQNMSLVISVDTSAVHFAASGKVPVVALYPKKIYRLCHQEWAPWQVKNRQIIMKDFMETSEEIINAVSYLLQD